MNALVVLVVLLLPLAYAATRSGILQREDYLFYAGRTPFLQTLSSVICGNIGIGTFVALLLFTAQSPVLGHAIALAYSTGLVLCAALAGRIHAAAQATRSFGLVDYIVRAHGVRHPLTVWVPVALVFGLRTTVQLLALSLIVTTCCGLSTAASLVLVSSARAWASARSSTWM